MLLGVAPGLVQIQILKSILKSPIVKEIILSSIAIVIRKKL